MMECAVTNYIFPAKNIPFHSRAVKDAWSELLRPKSNACVLSTSSDSILIFCEGAGINKIYK